jgi:hypothetical protein
MEIHQMNTIDWQSLRNMTPSQLENFGFRRWGDGKIGTVLMLIPGSLRDQIPLHYELESIMGETVLADVKAEWKQPGYVDDDTRGGLLAYGIRVKS